MVQIILAATDGSEPANKAVSFAADMARTYDAKLVILHAVSQLGEDRVPKNLQAFARAEHIGADERDVLETVASQILRAAEVLAREHQAPEVTTLITFGDPASEILAAARKQRADAIVVGNRGLGVIEGLLLGSVSHKVSHLCECTCIVVR
jgi:nucleotide-binding universal stress UspA family protein